MEFSPKIGLKIKIDKELLEFHENPLAKGIVHKSEGGQGVVYKISNGKNEFALKVLNDKFRKSAQVIVTEKINFLSEYPGFRVAKRVVINPKVHYELIGDHPGLVYGNLMPWIHGQTWFEVMARKIEISKEDSIKIALAIACSLSTLEKNNFAHCDVAGTNIIIPYLQNKIEYNGDLIIEFIDIEDLFLEDFNAPEGLPKGSDGYNHNSGENGIWNQYADRFSAAILISEVLAWSNPEIRQESGIESYFSSGETQKPGEKINLLLSDLRNRYGERVADLLYIAWNSTELKECQSIEAWMEAMDIVNNENSELKKQKKTSENNISDSLDAEIFSMQTKASELEESGDIDGAYNKYKQILEKIELDDEFNLEIPGILKRLKEILDEEDIDENEYENEYEKVIMEVDLPPIKPHGRKVTESTTKIAYYAIAAFIGIVMFWDVAVSLAENLSNQNKNMLAYGLVAGLGGMSQLLFLKFNVKNKGLWGALSVIGGMVIGYYMTYVNYLEYSPATQAFFFGGLFGAVVGLAQTWLLDKEYQYLRKIWVGMSFVGWAFGWGLSSVISWDSGTAIANAIGAAIIIVFTGVAIDPIVRKVSGFEV